MTVIADTHQIAGVVFRLYFLDQTIPNQFSNCLWAAYDARRLFVSLSECSLIVALPWFLGSSEVAPQPAVAPCTINCLSREQEIRYAFSDCIAFLWSQADAKRLEATIVREDGVVGHEGDLRDGFGGLADLYEFGGFHAAFKTLVVDYILYH